MPPRPADLLAASRVLVESFVSIDTPQQAHRFLRQVNDQFGDSQFPALLKLFCIVGESDDDAAKRLLARGFNAALERGDLMSSFLPAWGRSDLSHSIPASSGSSARPTTRAQSRLDPIQYLCAWHSQRTSFTPLSAAVFRKSLESMLRVFLSDPPCVANYRQKLTDDLTSLPEGALSALPLPKLRVW
jgi:hypothetical protein